MRTVQHILDIYWTVFLVRFSQVLKFANTKSRTEQEP